MDPSLRDSIMFLEELPWKSFSSWNTLPLEHSDHLVIFCRDAVIESLSATIDELHVSSNVEDFPVACKLRDQKYACVQIGNLCRPGALDTTRLLQQPMFLKEISAFKQLMCTTRSRIDCMKYGKLLPKEAVHRNTQLCVVPLYTWIPINEDAVYRVGIDHEEMNSFNQLSMGADQSQIELTNILMDARPLRRCAT
jgi:hypothetical protein